MTPTYMYIRAYYYTALWLYQKFLSAVVLDEKMTVIELEFHEQKTVLSIMNHGISRLSISMTSSEIKGALSSYYTAASVISSRLMRSGDIETNPGPGMSFMTLYYFVM
jgi:hypothetical protein